MNGLSWVTRILVVVGALNWGLVGAFNFNLVDTIFGSLPTIAMIIYILVGLSGLWELIALFKKE
jgi:uncharacterized protein